MEEWTKELPRKAGYYWFYGDPFLSKTNNDLRISLNLVEVIQTSNSFAYITHGGFMYPYDCHPGYWIKAVVPELPSKG